MNAGLYEGKQREAYEQGWNETMRQIRNRLQGREDAAGYALTIRAVASSCLFLNTGPSYVRNLAQKQAVDYYLAKGETPLYR